MTSIFFLDAGRQILQVLLFLWARERGEEGTGADGYFSLVLGGLRPLWLLSHLCLAGIVVGSGDPSVQLTLRRSSFSHTP